MNRLPRNFHDALLAGQVIPAHPLALNKHGKLDERRQRALSRYYLAAGAGGLAVGVHTTQFAIRNKDLLKPVLEIAAAEIAENGNKDCIGIAGVIGKTQQAMGEAKLAVDSGYHAALLSLGACEDFSDDDMISHCREIAEIIPIIGFYLQPSVGGRSLSYEFWRKFCEIENVVAIKVAPFCRYQTIDVLRGLADSGRSQNIALYTGNDDSIVIDLLTKYVFSGVELSFAGGLLGHWAVWTREAVNILHACGRYRGSQDPIPQAMLSLAVEVTDCNAAFFDVKNHFAGCIPGIHEVLRRQRLLEGIWCIDPAETLSSGQASEIERVCAAYPHLNDDAFVEENLDEWLG
jgi:dihydrodipicolinate synthase/N-acetylneuraminate lyase